MRGFALAGAGVAIVAVTAISVAPSSSARDEAPPGLSEVIEIVAEQADDEVIDLGAAGFGVGDQLIIADSLTVDGDVVGTSAGTCQVVELDTATIIVNCVTTLDLPDGQVTLQGRLAVGGGAETFQAAVTGGTGRYRSAHGEVSITPVDADTERYRLLVIR